MARRCCATPHARALYGSPLAVDTVDRFQGQQADIVLLSLVRTRAVGHIRDVRRLVVAVSRARLGLYVFGRKELFAQCVELRPVFDQLLARPTQLQLAFEAKGAEGDGQVLPERHPCARAAGAAPPRSRDVSGVGEMQAIVAGAEAGEFAERARAEQAQHADAFAAELAAVAQAEAAKDEQGGAGAGELDMDTSDAPQ